MQSALASVFELFSVGVGPSSSHTVGPMRAANRFADALATSDDAARVARLSCALFGSLAATGPGHRTPQAIVAGLCGARPETTTAAAMDAAYARWQAEGVVALPPAAAPTGCEAAGQAGSEAAGQAAGGPPDAAHGDRTGTGTLDAANGGQAGGPPHDVALTDLSRHPDIVLARHANGMRLEAFDADDRVLRREVFYSIGGGFIESDPDEAAAGAGSDAAAGGTAGAATGAALGGETAGRPGDPTGAPLAASAAAAAAAAPAAAAPPYPYCSAEQLLNQCRRTGLGIAELQRANEAALAPGRDVDAALDAIWQAMTDCIEAGLAGGGILPGGLAVRRRAARLAARLRAAEAEGARDTGSQWLQAYAMAVGEENAAGGRVVTAPTNGAAGIIPAVLTYALRFCHPVMPRPHAEFLLVAGAIGALYKRNASISGAEAGCQGEVGSAASMAAGAFAHILGGTPGQVENAAEIAMEQHLGLTCDPVAGLVQMPCIERNAIAAGTAVAAARLALAGDGTHRISLDTVIETMRQTGADMSAKYKETAQGGLAVNVVEC